LGQLHVFPGAPQGVLHKPMFSTPSRICGNITNQCHWLKNGSFLSFLFWSRQSHHSFPAVLCPIELLLPHPYPAVMKVGGATSLPDGGKGRARPPCMITAGVRPLSPCLAVAAGWPAGRP
jgi:hypothetical protein